MEVINELEEEEDMNELRAGFKERHHKRLYEAIDMVPPPTKKVCPERVQEEPTRRAHPMTMPQPDVVGPSTVVMAQPDVAGPSSTSVAEKEACGTEAGSDAAPAEGVSDEKDSLAPAAPPS